MYFWAIRSPSPVQNQLSLAQVDFSLFVLELPLPNRKAEVIFPLFVLELPLPNRKAEVRISLFILELPLPNRKAEVRVPLFVLQPPLPNRKAKSRTSRYLIWKIAKPIRKLSTLRFGTSLPNRKEEVQVVLFVLERDRKAEVGVPLFVLEVLLPNRNAKI